MSSILSWFLISFYPCLSYFVCLALKYPTQAAQEGRTCFVLQFKAVESIVAEKV